MSLELYIKQFEDYLSSERRYSNHTVTAYSKDVNQFTSFCVIEGYADSMPNADILRKWIRYLLIRGMSEKTVHRKASAVKTFSKFLFQSKVLQKLPELEVSLPKLRGKIPTYIKELELGRLLEDLENNAKDYPSFLEFIIISTFYHTGVRRSELIEITDEKLSTANKELKILGKGGKERIVPLSSEIVKQLKSFKVLKEQNGIVSNYFFCKFGGEKLSARWLYSLVNKLLSTTDANKHSPHILRHSFATHLLQNGADINAIKELLGHSSLSSTQLYAHNDIAKLKSIYNQTHPFSD